MHRLARECVVLAVLGVAMAMGVVWSLGVLGDRRSAALRSAADASACEGLAGRIAALRDAPMAVHTRRRDMGELTQRIEQSAEAAQIEAAHLVRIWPQPARRVGAEGLREMPTLVVLREVTLRQLISFLYGLSEGESGLRATRLRLSASEEREGLGRWTVETTLSYMVYGSETGGGGEQ